MKKTTIPTTPGLWWVKYDKERKRRLVIVTKGLGGCLVAETPGRKKLPVNLSLFSDWQKPGRPAAKDRSAVATTSIQLRVSKRRKRAYQKAQKAARCQSLAQWIFVMCDAAAGFEAESGQ